MGVWSGRVLPFPASYIWSFSIPQSMSFRRSLRRLAAVLAFGASSIFWKAAAMIIRAQNPRDSHASDIGHWLRMTLLFGTGSI